MYWGKNVRIWLEKKSW